MVDAQAVDQALGDQFEDFCVSGFEHRRALHTQTAQFVDIEKAPPVDVIRRRAPTGEAIALTFQQLVQALETVRRERIVGLQVLLDDLKQGRVAGQFAQLVFQRFGQAVGVSLVTQGAEAVGQ
ncbi:hypothetical protein D3C84_703920 [compost metagenome]